MSTFQGTTKIREAYKKTFPKVSQHDEARCLCGSSLRGVRTMTSVVNGVPKVSVGQWFGRCLEDCGLGGFYDIVEGHDS